ncbi:putative hydro-lyase [Pontibacillus yanchengensis]|nr:putative hydro-lyase [Pontibacillus yanchengensis]
MSEMNPTEERLAFRKGLKTGTTSGMCEGYVQTNMVVLQKEYASDFLAFCKKNPKSCPLVEKLDTGQVAPNVAPEADIRTDLPRYRIYREGVFAEEVFDLRDVWQDDFVTFLIGCSFTFEKALVEAGIPLLHQLQQKVVPMFKTNIELESSGIFAGNMVVSMRPIPNQMMDKALRVSEQFGHAHGGPVQVGNPEQIGIQDVMNPDYGEAVKFDENISTPIFWACGVTPQNVALKAKPSIMITHAPGHMLITDEVDEYYR